MNGLRSAVEGDPKLRFQAGNDPAIDSDANPADNTTFIFTSDVPRGANFSLQDPS